MGLGKSLKKIAGNVIAPVFTAPAKAIEKSTGLDWKQQLGIGAGVGGAAMLMGRSGQPAAGTTAGGQSSAGGVMRAFGGNFLSGIGNSLGSNLLPAAAAYFGSREQSESQERANEANVNLAREQMAFSAAQADRQMAFQERMAGSSYQRAVEDMKKAGINPMLAIDQGGASSPSGASGSPAGANLEPVPSVLANTVASALDMMRTYASAKQALASARHSDKQSDIKGESVEEARFSGRIWRVMNSIMDRVGQWWRAPKPNYFFGSPDLRQNQGD